MSKDAKRPSSLELKDALDNYLSLLMQAESKLSDSEHQSMHERLGTACRKRANASPDSFKQSA